MLLAQDRQQGGKKVKNKNKSSLEQACYGLEIAAKLDMKELMGVFILISMGSRL